MEVAALVIRQKIDKPVRLHVKKGSGIRVRTSGQRVAVKGARIYTGITRQDGIRRILTIIRRDRYKPSKKKAIGKEKS